MHARVDGERIQLLTRTGLDWSRRYRFTIEALRSLPVKMAYIDGELCALRPDGVPAFSRLQAAMDEGRTDDLIFIAFDLLYLNGKSTAARPHIERKERLRALFARPIRGLRFSDHVVGNGRRFHEEACRLGVEGVIPKRVDRPYAAWSGRTRISAGGLMWTWPSCWQGAGANALPMLRVPVHLKHAPPGSCEGATGFPVRSESYRGCWALVMGAKCRAAVHAPPLLTSDGPRLDLYDDREALEGLEHAA
jgi:ATP dependent DNA ligase domain